MPLSGTYYIMLKIFFLLFFIIFTPIQSSFAVKIQFFLTQMKTDDVRKLREHILELFNTIEHYNADEVYYLIRIPDLITKMIEESRFSSIEELVEFYFRSRKHLTNSYDVKGSDSYQAALSAIEEPNLSLIKKPALGATKEPKEKDDGEILSVMIYVNILKDLGLEFSTSQYIKAQSSSMHKMINLLRSIEIELNFRLGIKDPSHSVEIELGLNRDSNCFTLIKVRKQGK